MNQKINEAKSAAVMNFVDMMISALADGFVDKNSPTLSELHRIAETHINDNYGVIVQNIVERWGLEIAEECGLGAPTAIVDIAAERNRQITEEGWTPEHDDQHDGGELSGAAAAYALYTANKLHPHSQGDGFDAEHLPPGWCWDPAWFKPTTPRRNLVKAAALIVAEIERIDRIEKSGNHS